MSESLPSSKNESTVVHTFFAVLCGTTSVWVVAIQLFRMLLQVVPLEANLWLLGIFIPLSTLGISLWVRLAGNAKSFWEAMTWTTLIPVVAVLHFPALPQFIANRWCDASGGKSLRVFPMSRWLVVWPMFPTTFICNCFLDAGFDPSLVSKTWWTVVVLIVLALPNFVEDDPAITNRTLKLVARRGRWAWILLIIGMWTVVVNIPWYVSKVFPHMYHRDYFQVAAFYGALIAISATLLSTLLFNFQITPSSTTSQDLVTGEKDTHTTFQHSLSLLDENPVRFWLLLFCQTVLFTEHEGTVRYAPNVYFSHGVHRRVMGVRALRGKEAEVG